MRIYGYESQTLREAFPGTIELATKLKAKVLVEPPRPDDPGNGFLSPKEDDRTSCRFALGWGMHCVLTPWLPGRAALESFIEMEGV